MQQTFAAIFPMYAMLADLDGDGQPDLVLTTKSTGRFDCDYSRLVEKHWRGIRSTGVIGNDHRRPDLDRRL
jgi:hypothetical protein